MNILLIQPPMEDFYRTRQRAEPIGLAYLAASLKQHGHEVKILDCQTGEQKSISIPPELGYLREFYPPKDRSPFKLYQGYAHFGMGWEEIKRNIKTSKAEVFGISSSFTPYHREALEVARIIKAWDSRKLVVMGGSHVSGDPEGVLKDPSVDYVILGEGEHRFPLLLEGIERGNLHDVRRVDGLGYRDHGTIRITPLQTLIEDLDTLPSPERSLLDLDRYRKRKLRSTMVITSRGCPQQCAYCSGHLHMGARFRARSPDHVVGEMTEAFDRYGIRCFDFEDDNFTFDQERAKRLLMRVVDAFGERRIELSAMNGISFASLNGELLGLMKRAGFHTINLSLVSADRETRKKIGRPADLSRFDDVLKEAGAVGLHVVAYAILGMPGQDVEEMVETLVYLMGKRVLIGPSIFYPVPGTPLFDECRTTGRLPPCPTQWRSSAFPIETDAFNRLDLVTLFRLTRSINFLKSQIDAGVIEEGMSWHDLRQWIRGQPRVPWANGGRRASTEDGSDDGSWVTLLRLLCEERSFYSLRPGQNGRLLLRKEMSSRKVLDAFFEQAVSKPILRSNNGGVPLPSGSEP